MALGLLHLADVHLGAAPAGAVEGDLARRLHAERLETLERALQEAVRRRAAAVLVAGDLFEGRYAVRELVRAVADRLRACGLPVFVVPGNHDPAREGSYYRTYPWPEHVSVLWPEEPTAVRVGGLPLVVHGFGWTGNAIHAPALRGFAAPDDGHAHVLLLHADLDPPGGASPYRPLASPDLRASGAAYVALGHVHTRRTLPVGGGRDLAAYPGSLCPLGFGEPGPHGALWLEVEPGVAGARLEFLDLAPRQYRTLELASEEGSSPADLAARVRAALPPDAVGRDLLRLRVRGESPDGGLGGADLRAALADVAPHIEVEDCTEPAWDLDALAAEHPRGLLARFVAAMRVRQSAADDAAREAAATAESEELADPDPEAPAPGAAEREVAALALRYGVQALTGRQIGPL